MKSHAQIKEELDALKRSARDLNIVGVGAADVKAEHIALAKKINHAIREHSETWRMLGVMGPHEEWAKFKMSDTNGLNMSVWVSHHR